jgi:hypothetical protein
MDFEIIWNNVFVQAMVKFAILGTLGEVVAKLINKSKITTWQVFYSMLVWAILGVIIKFIFTGFHGFTDKLIEIGYLPSGIISKAFFMSFFVNVMFGPWIIISHRFLDILPYKTFKIKTDGLKGALLTLLWFWIPAHTVTFSLQSHDWQITLAAAWGFVLGLILGIFNNLKSKSDGLK